MTLWVQAIGATPHHSISVTIKTVNPMNYFQDWLQYYNSLPSALRLWALTNDSIAASVGRIRAGNQPDVAYAEIVRAVEGQRRARQDRLGV